jgi:hypothetical protein
VFTESQTRPLLEKVQRRLGVVPTQATLLRHHTNAVYALDDVIVKIAPPKFTVDHLRPMIETVRWLIHHSFPTVDLYPEIDQPFEIDGHVITAWRRLDPADDNPVTTAELASLLRRLHALPDLPHTLRIVDPVDEIRRSIATSAILSDEERRLVSNRTDQLACSWHDMSFPLPAGLIHGDPQTRNALRRPDGSPVRGNGT